MVAAESLSKQLGDEHEITLVSRGRRFLFYPALVRLAFGQCEPDDVSFDLRKSMMSRSVNFIEAEVARIDPQQRQVVLAHGEVAGRISYDYLIFALGRRLATERVSGFFERAHHLLDLGGALKFGEAVREFKSGRIIIGQCPDARLPVPVYEAAFALAKLFGQNGVGANSKITIVSPSDLESEWQDADIAAMLAKEMRQRNIEYVPNFPVQAIGSRSITTADNRELDYGLLMLLPPFAGSSAISHLGITDLDGYLNVDWTMKVLGAEGMYAAGDCVSFSGPKMGHMAVSQAEVAAANLAAEISGHPPVSHYQHDLMMVIEADGDGIYFHKDLWADESARIRHGRFWTWAKRIHEKYWQAIHD